ncbi:uncharacterized protein LOC144727782 [Lampetra planeri]
MAKVFSVKGRPAVSASSAKLRRAAPERHKAGGSQRGSVRSPQAALRFDETTTAAHGSTPSFVLFVPKEAICESVPSLLRNSAGQRGGSAGAAWGSMGEVGRIDATLVNHMAKVFDANACRRQGPAGGLGIVRKLPVLSRKSSIDSVSTVDIKLDLLTLKVDALLEMQHKVFEKLDEMSQEITDLGKDVEAIKVNQEEVVRGGVSQVRRKSVDAESQRRIQELYAEMSGMMTSMKQSSEKQGRKIEGLERMMSGLQGVISFLGETFKNSRLVEFVLKGRAPSRHGSVAERGEDEDGISNSRAKQDVKVER